MTSKAEYLKKYYGGGEMKKKKKKVTKQTTNKSTVIILDDNPDWRNSGQSNDEDDSDTPIIVGKDYSVYHHKYTCSNVNSYTVHTCSIHYGEDIKNEAIVHDT